MTTAPRRPPRARGIVVAALVGALVAGSPVAAGALWSATAQAPTVDVRGGTLTAPVVSCQSMPAQGGSLAFARLSWPAVPGATGYTVTLRNSINAESAVLATGVTLTTYDVRGNLLSGLLWILGILLSGGTLQVTVTATNGAWTSADSTRVPLALATLLGGLLGDVKCA